jgi:hypothetical protein
MVKRTSSYFFGSVLSHSSSSSGHFAGGKPFFTRCGMISHTVRSLIKDRHAHRHAKLFQVCLDVLRHLNGRSALKAIIRGMHEKYRRCVPMKHKRRLFLPPMPRGQTNGEVRTDAIALDGISRLHIASVKIRREVHAQIASRRITRDADLLRIDSPLGCTMPHQPHRTLRIQQSQRLDAGVVQLVRWPQTVFQADDCHALRIENRSGVFHMRLPVQRTVATACAHEDRHARAFVRWRQKERDGRHRHIADRAAFLLHLRRCFLQKLRRLAWPQRDRLSSAKGDG